MTRSSTTAFNNAIAADNVDPFFAVKLEFESGTSRFWTGVDDISFEAGSGSETFTGVGDLLSVSAVEETNDIEAGGVSFSLSGINSSLISLTLSENYQGRKRSRGYGWL